MRIIDQCIGRRGEKGTVEDDLGAGGGGGGGGGVVVIRVRGKVGKEGGT